MPFSQQMRGTAGVHLRNGRGSGFHIIKIMFSLELKRRGKLVIPR
jgi:hypothetical protein